MNVGTKSLLFGIHQFALHPILVAIAWVKLFGWNFDPRLWICFIVHDWGYWGKPDMNGEMGQQHPTTGARIVRVLFGKEWSDFCLNHSRLYAKANHSEPSLLCYADKYAICLYPKWIYIILGNASGEINEYVNDSLAAKDDIFKKDELKDMTISKWVDKVVVYFDIWVQQNVPSANQRLFGLPVENNPTNQTQNVL